MNLEFGVNSQRRDEGPQSRLVGVEQCFQAIEPRDAGQEGLIWPYEDLRLV